jgi:hypothetical protein
VTISPGRTPGGVAAIGLPRNSGAAARIATITGSPILSSAVPQSATTATAIAEAVEAGAMALIWVAEIYSSGARTPPASKQVCPSVSGNAPADTSAWPIARGGPAVKSEPNTENSPPGESTCTAGTLSPAPLMR